MLLRNETCQIELNVDECKVLNKVCSLLNRIDTELNIRISSTADSDLNNFIELIVINKVQSVAIQVQLNYSNSSIKGTTVALKQTGKILYNQFKKSFDTKLIWQIQENIQVFKYSTKGISKKHKITSGFEYKSDFINLNTFNADNLVGKFEIKCELLLAVLSNFSIKSSTISFTFVGSSELIISNSHSNLNNSSNRDEQELITSVSLGTNQMISVDVNSISDTISFYLDLKEVKCFSSLAVDLKFPSLACIFNDDVLILSSSLESSSIKMISSICLSSEHDQVKKHAMKKSGRAKQLNSDSESLFSLLPAPTSASGYEEDEYEDDEDEVIPGTPVKRIETLF